MVFLQRIPRPPLNAFVEKVWVCRQDIGPVTFERILPTGAAQLIVNLKEDETRVYDLAADAPCRTSSGTVLTGVLTRYQIIDTSEQEFVAGVSFKPGGTVPFFAVPARETVDADVPLADLWGRISAAVLREQLLEAATLDAMLDVVEAALLAAWTPRPLHAAVAFAIAALHRSPGASVTALADASGMSAKRFIERFKCDVGVTPKQFSRIRRFQHAVTRAHRGHAVDWARLAVECGYFDQAHFIHDFRSFAGVTPTGYQADRTLFHNHVKVVTADLATLRA